MPCKHYRQNKAKIKEKTFKTMAIIEKKIKIPLKKGSLPEINVIENAIIKAGLEPVRWAIVDINENEYTILANGIQK